MIFEAPLLIEWLPDKDAYLCTPLYVVPIAGIRRARRTAAQMDADTHDALQAALADSVVVRKVLDRATAEQPRQDLAHTGHGVQVINHAEPSISGA